MEWKIRWPLHTWNGVGNWNWKIGNGSTRLPLLLAGVAGRSLCQGGSIDSLPGLQACSLASNSIVCSVSFLMLLTNHEHVRARVATMDPNTAWDHAPQLASLTPQTRHGLCAPRMSLMKRLGVVSCRPTVGAITPALAPSRRLLFAMPSSSDFLLSLLMPVITLGALCVHWCTPCNS